MRSIKPWPACAVLLAATTVLLPSCMKFVKLGSDLDFMGGTYIVSGAVENAERYPRLYGVVVEWDRAKHKVLSADQPRAKGTSRRSLHPPDRGVEDLVHEALVERGVAHQEAEEERAVEEVEGDFDVHIAPHFAVCLGSFQEGFAFRATSEDEVIAERLRQLGFGVGGGEHRRDVTAGAGGEASGHGAKLRAQRGEGQAAGSLDALLGTRSACRRMMLADEYPDFGCLSPVTVGGSPVALHLYVEDVDAIVARATAAGATLLRPVQDEFFGDRTGMLTDPFGHKWHLATRKEDVSPEEMQKRMNAAFA